MLGSYKLAGELSGALGMRLEVQSLARLALVLERNGQPGTGAAAAATAVAAVVAKQGDDTLGHWPQAVAALPSLKNECLIRL